MFQGFLGTWDHVKITLRPKIIYDNIYLLLKTHFCFQILSSCKVFKCLWIRAEPTPILSMFFNRIQLSKIFFWFFCFCSLQVAPDFAYSYTLLGHEYVLTEELDKALSCFRNAIRVDPRHYNARWVQFLSILGFCVCPLHSWIACRLPQSRPVHTYKN